ncbi:MAG: hypothetical protein AB1Z57_03730 [Acidimicrobiia bacterium]
MTRPKVLFIGGALNQTKIAHAVARELDGEVDAWFSPFYMDAGFVGALDRASLLEWTALGGAFREASLSYLADHGLAIDEGGCRNNYDVVVTGSDLVVQKNIRRKPLVLLQEGMTDPENALYHLVRTFRLPRYLASTASFGMSHAYDYLCAASEGYQEHFIGKGIPAEKIVVTGLPHWDDLAAGIDRSAFPHSGFVLVATSDARETFKVDRRRRFLREAVRIADGRPLVFKLHPNEKPARAIREIRAVAPDALVFTDGDINEMIARCDALVTQYSTVVYTGMALGKECHSYFDMDELRRLMPMQNGGTSAARMAGVTRHLLQRRSLADRRRLVDVCACSDCRSGANDLHATAG